MQEPLDPVELAVELMRIDSTTGREGDLMRFVGQRLEPRGWRVHRIPVSEDALHASRHGSALHPTSGRRRTALGTGVR